MNAYESQVQISNIFLPAVIALTLCTLFDFSTGGLANENYSNIALANALSARSLSSFIMAFAMSSKSLGWIAN
ncbi:hypothetical protein AB3480_20400 [Rhizobium mongolense]|uniref:hypothetical protein n=2 Tax=Rhizobium mongolense TaxID=57676 RepID=UPI0034A257C1